MEGASATDAGAILRVEIGGGVEEITLCPHVRKGQNHGVLLRGLKQIPSRNGGIQLTHGNHKVFGGHAALVVVHHLENNTVSGLELGVPHLNHRGGALDHQGGFSGLEGGILNFKNTVGIPEHHGSEPPAQQGGTANDRPAQTIFPLHQHGIAIDLYPGILQNYGISPDAEGTVAVGAGAGELKVAVLNMKGHWCVRAVNGADTPAVGEHPAVVVGDFCPIAELHQTAGSQQGQLPAEIPHPIGIRTPVDDLTVPYHHIAAATHMNGTAGHAVKVEFAVLHLELCMVDGGNGRTDPQKVVVRKALKGELAVTDGIIRIAMEDDAVKGLGPGGKIGSLYLPVIQGAPLKHLRDPHLGALFVHHQGCGEIPGDIAHAHQGMGLHVIDLCHVQHHVSVIGAGHNILADPVDHQRHRFSLRRNQHRIGGDGQLGKPYRPLNEPGGLVQQTGRSALADFFHSIHTVHRLTSFPFVFYIIIALVHQGVNGGDTLIFCREPTMVKNCGRASPGQKLRLQQRIIHLHLTLFRVSC